MSKSFVPILRRTQIAVCVTSMTLSTAVLAGPMGAEVVHGSASFNQQGNSLQISNSHGTIINWQDFSIAQAESVNFLQTHASSAILNRVISNIPSDILGELTSNGRVFIINPNGLIIGRDARIDTAGFVASTLNISDHDFIAGKMKFVGDSGEIENHGYIAAGPGGEVVLIAPNVENHGIIEADDGSILLAAGREVILHSIQNGGLSYKVSAPGDSVLNIGELVAKNGSVKVFADQIFQQGAISATRARHDADGNIVLEADTQLSVSGDLNATGDNAQGGAIHLLGDQVDVTNANIDASGEGGGEILIGGDYQGNGEVKNAQNTNTDAATVIRADGGVDGAGGRVIVWSDDTTNTQAKITARGGTTSGDGGFVETSGKKTLNFGQPADVSATDGAAGTWLLDPEDIVIDEAGAASISTSLNGGSNVEVRTSDEGDGEGNITVDAPITKSEGEAAVELTLDAHNRVDVNAPITTTAGPLNLNIKTGRQVVAVDTTEAEPDLEEEEALAEEVAAAEEATDSEPTTESTDDATDTSADPSTEEVAEATDESTPTESPSDDPAEETGSEELVEATDTDVEPEEVADTDAGATESTSTDTEVAAETETQTEVEPDVEPAVEEIVADAQSDVDTTVEPDLAVEADTELAAEPESTSEADVETTSQADGFIEESEQQIVIAADIFTGGGDISIDAGEDGDIVILADVDSSALDEGEAGDITLEGERIAIVDDADVDASGNDAGDIKVGGGLQGHDETVDNAEIVLIGSDATVSADGGDTGDGGTVIIFSEQASIISGNVSAQGGISSGSGGYIETSGLRSLQVSNAPNVGASSGVAGTWLIDPYDISIISAEGGVNNVMPDPPEAGPWDVTPTGSGAYITTSTLRSALQTGNVTISTTNTEGTEYGDIDFVGNLSFFSGQVYDLTLNADRNIYLSGDITFSNSGGVGAFTFNAPSGEIYSSGDITFNSANDVTGFTLNSGGDITFSSDVRFGNATRPVTGDLTLNAYQDINFLGNIGAGIGTSYGNGSNMDINLNAGVANIAGQGSIDIALGSGIFTFGGIRLNANLDVDNQGDNGIFAGQNSGTVDIDATLGSVTNGEGGFIFSVSSVTVDAGQSILNSGYLGGCCGPYYGPAPGGPGPGAGPGSGSTYLDAGLDVVNFGTVASTYNVSISAGRNITDYSDPNYFYNLYSYGGSVQLSADGDINVYGRVYAYNDITINAGGAVQIADGVTQQYLRSYEADVSVIAGSGITIQDTGNIVAAATLSLNAGTDIQLYGAADYGEGSYANILQSGGDTTIFANGDVGSDLTLEVGGALSITATSGDVTLNQFTLDYYGDLDTSGTIRAENNITISAGDDVSGDDVSGDDVSSSASMTTTSGSIAITAGAALPPTMDRGDVNLSVNLNADDNGSVTINATGGITTDGSIYANEAFRATADTGQIILMGGEGTSVYASDIELNAAQSIMIGLDLGTSDGDISVYAGVAPYDPDTLELDNITIASNVSAYGGVVMRAAGDIHQLADADITTSYGAVSLIADRSVTVNAEIDSGYYDLNLIANAGDTDYTGTGFGVVTIENTGQDRLRLTSDVYFDIYSGVGVSGGNINIEGAGLNITSHGCTSVECSASIELSALDINIGSEASAISGDVSIRSVSIAGPFGFGGDGDGGVTIEAQRNLGIFTDSDLNITADDTAFFYNDEGSIVLRESYANNNISLESFEALTLQAADISLTSGVGESAGVLIDARNQYYYDYGGGGSGSGYIGGNLFITADNLTLGGNKVLTYTDDSGTVYGATISDDVLIIADASATLNIASDLRLQGRYDVSDAGDFGDNGFNLFTSTISSFGDLDVEVGGTLELNFGEILLRTATGDFAGEFGYENTDTISTENLVASYGRIIFDRDQDDGSIAEAPGELVLTTNGVASNISSGGFDPGGDIAVLQLSSVTWEQNGTISWDSGDLEVGQAALSFNSPYSPGIANDSIISNNAGGSFIVNGDNEYGAFSFVNGNITGIIENAGLIEKDGGGAQTDLFLGINNVGGQLDVSYGGLYVAGGITQTGGQISLAGGNLLAGPQVLELVEPGGGEGGGGAGGGGIVVIPIDGPPSPPGLALTGGFITGGFNPATGADGGTIYGNVTVKDSIISPGFSPGTLTIAGDFDASAGGNTFVFEVDTDTGYYDQLEILGNATITNNEANPNVIQAEQFGNFDPDPYNAVSASYTVITAGGGQIDLLPTTHYTADSSVTPGEYAGETPDFTLTFDRAAQPPVEPPVQPPPAAKPPAPPPPTPPPAVEPPPPPPPEIVVIIIDEIPLALPRDIVNVLVTLSDDEQAAYLESERVKQRLKAVNMCVGKV